MALVCTALSRTVPHCVIAKEAAAVAHRPSRGVLLLAACRSQVNRLSLYHPCVTLSRTVSQCSAHGYTEMFVHTVPLSSSFNSQNSP